MNPLRVLTEAVADRIHARGDALLRRQGLTVERLSGGMRRISDPRLPELLDQRRLRILRHGFDPIDRALIDPATAELFAATARRAGIDLPPIPVIRRAGRPAASPRDVTRGRRVEAVRPRAAARARS